MSEVIKGIRLRTLTPEEQAERDRIRQEQAPAQAAQIAALLTEHMNAATQSAALAAAEWAAVPKLKDPEALEIERQEREMNASFRQFRAAREAQERVMREAHERERQERERDRQALAAAVVAAHRASATPPPDPTARPDPEPKRTRTDCLKQAILNAVADLSHENGRNPTMGEVRQYLKTRDSTGYVVSVTDKLISWRDWDGKKQTANARNMTERLNRYLKDTR